MKYSGAVWSAGEENDNRLAKYMQYGWECYGNVLFAPRYLNSKAEKPGDEGMAKALKQFPENGPLIRTELATRVDKKPTREDLVATENRIR